MSNVSVQVDRLSRAIADSELASNGEEKRFRFGATLKRCDIHFATQVSNTVVFTDALEKMSFEVKKC